MYKQEKSSWKDIIQRVAQELKYIDSEDGTLNHIGITSYQTRINTERQKKQESSASLA